MIYIDTGAFIARYLYKDQHHSASVKYWEQIENSNKRCFTSNFVLDETLTLLARRTDYKFASRRGRNILLSGAFTIIRPAYEDELLALNIFEKYSDLEISFTDCISFVLINKNKINSVFSFDKHFSILGFNVFPPTTHR